jgi:RimJ/RimL family protein N-acetyltransferase
MATLETERLRMRMFREDDLDAYAAMCADPDVMRYIGAGGAITRADAWRQMALFLGHWELRGYGMWAVEERATGALIGRIGLYNPDGWPGFECGWLLARASWGKGYATEGARRALEHAFTTLGREHVISLIRPDNAASIRVAERIGETLERTVTLLGGSALVYGISQQSFRK